MSNFNAREYIKKKYSKTDEEEEKTTKTTQSTSFARSYITEKYRKQKAEEFGLDTLESDINSLAKTITDINEGWQTEETMANTRSSIEAMQERISAYQEYQKTYGGEDLLGDVAKAYKETLGKWDEISADYGRYKSADEYNAAKKEYEGKTKANLDDVQKEIDSLSTLLGQAEELEKKVGNKKPTVQGKLGEPSKLMSDDLSVFLKKHGYGSVQDLRDAVEDKKFYLEDAQRIQDEIKLEKEETKKSKSEEGKQGWELFLADEEAAKAAEENKTWEEKVAESFALAGDASIPGSELITVTNLKRKYKDENAKPTEDWTEAEQYTFGAYYLEDPEKAYDYGARINNAKGQEKQNKKTNKTVDSATSNFWSGAGHTLGAILTAPTALIDATNDMTDVAAGRRIVETGDVSPFEYSQAVTSGISTHLNEVSGTLDEDIPIIGGKGLGDLYGLGTSIAQSAVSGYTLGGIGTLVSYFGQGAAAGVDEALSRGATDEQALLYGTILGAAEGVSEMIGIDNLFKIGSSRTLKEFFMNVLRQGGAEGLEEGFSSIVGNIADNFVMQDKSNFNALVKEYMAQGLTASEAKNKAWTSTIGDIAYDVLGGFVSGAAHAAPHTGIATLKANSVDKSYGQKIKSGEQTSNMLEIASLTPEESVTYDLYTAYAKKGITADNISDAQLGRLYTSTKTDAHSTLSSKKSTDEQKHRAVSDLNKLGKLEADFTAQKRAKELAKGGETTVNDNVAKVEGIKLGKDEKIITSEGEVSIDDVNLSQRDALLVGYAEQMGEDEANLFLAQDDGQTDVAAYADSFNLVSLYAEHNFDQNTIIENKGVLSTEQVNAIYSGTVKAKAKAQQKVLDDLSAKHGNAMFVQGTVDDSIIDHKSKTTDGSKVNWNSLSSQQRSAIRFTKLFAKATGVNIKFIKSEVVDGKHKGKNGSYNAATNTIEIDVYAGRIDSSVATDTIIPTLSHEMTHWMKAKAISAYEGLHNDVLKTLSERSGVSSEVLINAEINRIKKAHPEKKNVTPEDAIDELVARACEDMLANSNEARKLLNRMSATEQQSFIEKMKETFDNLMQWVNDLLKVYKSESAEAEVLRQYKHDIQRISKQWDAMLKDAIKTNQALQKEGVLGEELINGISKDGSTIVGKNNLQMSERTYAEGGRDFLENWLNEQSGLSDEDKQDILSQTDMIAKLMRDIREGNELPEYSRWATMDVVKDENGEKVLSVIVKNGDYAMNIDFSQVCKKRVALNAVLNAMVQSGDLNTYVLTETDVSALNNIIKKHEFVIACALCFVDSKRYRVGGWAESFCEGADKKKKGKMVHQYGFNEMVRSLIPKGSNIQVDEFNFTNREIVGQPTSNLLSEMDDSKLDFTLIDEILEREFNEGTKPTDLYAYAKAIKDNKEIRKILNPAEIVSSIGLDAIRLETPQLYRLINRHQGTARPKFAHDVVAYGNDILKATNFNPEKAKMVGGVRCQSFSDFMANMVFDYVQFISELSAKELTSHAYTKEPLFVKLFGLTGMKINMSLVPKAIDMTPEQEQKFAILRDDKANKRTAEYRNALKEYKKLTDHAGLDDNGNYIWEDEIFPYDIAMEIVDDPRYSANCGTIAVGISDKHILKLLNDDRISMVIPYHKSGLNHAVAMMRNIALYMDYTKTQNTRFANGKKLEKVPDFNFYEDLYGTKDKDGTHDPKTTADNYLKWCAEHNYIPKFETSIHSNKFKSNPNYYKLLTDFRVYDIDGTYREQQAVKPIYPENEEFKDLILNGVVGKDGTVYGGLKQQQGTANKLDAESQQIVDEFREHLKDKYGKDVLGEQFADRGIKNTLTSTEQANLWDERLYSQLSGWLDGQGKKNGSFNGKYFEVGKTPSVFIKHGAPDSELIMYPDCVEKITGLKGDEGHMFAIEEIAKLPSQLNDPILLFKGSVSGSFVALTEIKDKHGNDAIVAVHINKRYGRSVINKIASVYSKTDVYGNNKIVSYVMNQISNGNLVDASNKKAPNWFTSRGLQLPKLVQTILDANNSIHQDMGKSQEQNSDRDSSGNPLSEEQIEFFKDSKVRDKNGNLLVVRHGTSEDFHIFDFSKAGKNGKAEGAGFYFSDEMEITKRYGEIQKEVYLNITKPMYNNKRTVKKAELINFVNALIDFDFEKWGTEWKDSFISNYINTYEFQMSRRYAVHEFVNQIWEYNDNDQDLIFEVAQADGKTYDNSSMKEFYDVLTKSIGYDGIIAEWTHADGKSNVYVTFNSEQSKYTTNTNPTVDPDMRYSDRETVSVYDKMGETERLKKDNEKLKVDVERLKERLVLERQVTHGNVFNENQLGAVAGHIRNISNSTYSKSKLIEQLKDVYSYIVQSEDLNYEDLLAKCYEVAQNVLRESSPKVTVDPYYKQILREIRGTRISVNEEQIGNAKYHFGEKWRNAFWGKVTIAKDGTGLDTKWGDWSKAYPNLFDADISYSDQLVELHKVYESVKESAEIVEEYDMEEQTRQLAREIYNQYWNVSTIRTTADKYDKQIKRLNFEHRKAMQEFRDDYNDRLKEQHKVDKAKAIELANKIRERKDKEIAEVRKLGKERLDAYKENAERKTKIQTITSEALTLNRWLTKNSKDEHIHEAMKGPVVALLNAIDFSSKQLLGMKGSVIERRGTPTRTDISLQKALSKVKDMMVDASNAKEGLIELYGHDMDKEIAKLAESVDDIMRSVGDNEFVLNKMSLAELETLDKLVKTIKHTVTKMNTFHTVQHKQGVANLSEEGIEHLESLGKAVKHSGFRGTLDYMVKWVNKIPYYAFKMLGNAGTKVFSALQDGWDKLAFNVKQITDFTNETYTSKEVREWSEKTKTFTLAQLDGNERTFEMTIAQIMAFRCVSKQEDAIRHLLSGGMTLAAFDKKGQVISEEENILLTMTDIETITNSLTERQKEVADKLQEFMNTVCAEWGNYVSMQRFAINMFTTENYFPIKVSPATITKEEPEGVNDVSLFRLLNMSFTKSRNEYANQSIEIGNIFDIFAQHTSDMAKYNALALPVLDAYRWYSYKGKTTIGKEYSTYASLQKALGKDSVRYFNTFLKDLNGSSNVARDNFGSNFFRNAKIASVAANLRVVLLQPTAYLKASAIIDNRYLTQAFLHKPKIAKAEKYCGMALWKSMGYYDVNISKGLTEKIKHDETKMDKAIDFSMKGAEIADKITFGYLWNACELEIRKTRKDLKVGSEEFYDTIAKRLREVIYATQVVDSTMTRSQMMRSPDGRDKMLTAFMSEPTLAYNMLMDCVVTTSLDKRENGKGAIKRNFKRNARVFNAYLVTNVVAALIESCFDVFRDDDEEEDDLVEFTKHYLTNFASDMSILGKIPYIKELPSILQGYSPSRTDTQWMESIVYAGQAWWKIFTGDGEGKGIKAIEHSLRAFSNISGLAFFNVYRDLMAALNQLDILTDEELEELFDELFGY